MDYDGFSTLYVNSQFSVDDRAVTDEKYDGSHFASFLPFNTCVVRGRLSIFRRKWIYYLQGIFICVFCLNVPSVSFQLQS